MQTGTSLFVDDWLDEEIASLEHSVAGPADTVLARSAGRSSRRRQLHLPRRPVLDTGRFLVYGLAMTVGATTGWVIAALLSKP